MTEQTLSDVQEYYGKVLQTKDDLRTSACCPLEAPSPRLQALLRNVHEAVQERFYGCGSPLPLAAEGCTVLDLGCGTGRDAFLLSQIVGERGRVIGVDMTDEQLAVATRHLDWHMERFGYERANVEFVKAYIEDLESAGIADESVDIVVSNCVINLSPDKERVFREIYRVLKPGGELLFSDVFSAQRIPQALRSDKILLGECLAGALYFEDFRRMMGRIGIADIRTVSKRQLTLDDAELWEKAGMIDFHSITVRTFKVDLEDRCENYGHVACYRGTIPESPHRFVLDDHHEFRAGLPVPVCGNTANMLSQTRLGRHFRVEGDFSTHFGLFDCQPAPAGSGAAEACC